MSVAVKKVVSFSCNDVSLRYTLMLNSSLLIYLSPGRVEYIYTATRHYIKVVHHFDSVCFL